MFHLKVNLSRAVTLAVYCDRLPKIFLGVIFNFLEFFLSEFRALEFFLFNFVSWIFLNTFFFFFFFFFWREYVFAQGWSVGRIKKKKKKTRDF